MSRIPGVRAAFAFGILLVAAILSCNSADTGGPAVQREVLPDGRVRLTYAASVPLREDTVVADVRIGSLEGDGPTTFGDLRGIAVGDDGAIYVLDVQKSELQAFNADGSFRATLTRSGQGPGEISRGHGVAMSPEGTLWINDSGNRAIVGISADGGEAGRYPLMVGGWAFYWSGSIDSRGVFWEQWGHSVEEPPFDITATGPVEATRRVYYKSFDPGTEAYDSVQIGLESARGYRAALASGGQLSMGIPFSSRRLATIDRNADIWTANAGAYGITKMNATGDTLIALHVEVDPSPVTEEDLEIWRESAAATFERAPGIRADIERLIPEQKPVLTRLVSDDEGRLWVERTVPPDHAPLFDVFDGEGSYISSVRLFRGIPDDPAPVIRDGRIHALVLGDFDEPYVVAAPLPAIFGGP